MKHILRRLILFLSLAATVGIFPNKVFATHLAGSDITYTCLGGNNYRIDLTFYRDCRGTSAPPSVLIDFHSVSCNMHFTDYLLPSNGTGQEITYPCPGLVTSCDDPNSSTPGIQEWKYSGIVNFPMQCADWVISWQYCCRNCDITTLLVTQPCVPGSNPGMYISATLDNLNFNCSSSPYFTNSPIVFVCIGQNFTYNHGAVDPNGDSLVYSLINPQDSANMPVTFLPGYSATNPITSSPALTINPVTGDIVINPTQQEVGILSVLVQAYRNGVLVGQVVRDMEIYSRPCINRIPTATGMNGTNVHDSTVCPGTQICFNVFSNDSDAGQIVTMSWNQQIPNATFTISGFPFPTGHFCWTPTVADISSIPHQFTVSVVDNACPNSGYQAYAFTITVNSPAMNITVTDISCHGANDGAISVVPVNPGVYTYHWMPGGQTTSGISNLPPGSYPVTVYDSTNGCTATFPDTLFNPPLLTDSAYASLSSCTGTGSGVAIAVPSGGTPPYSYSWNSVPVQNGDTATGLAAGTYTVTITDSHNCTTVSTVTVNSTSSPIISTVDSVSTLLCYTDSSGIAIITASGGIAPLTYSWNTIPPQHGDTATGLSPGTYFVTITDSAGCNTTDTATVNSPPPLTLTGHSTPASCNIADGSASVTVTGGRPGYTYSWNGTPDTTDSLPNVAPGVYTVNVTDTNGCTGQLPISVFNQTITTSATPISSVGCHGDSNAIAVATASGGVPPYTYQWNTVPPQNNDTAFGLSPGTYIVTISDSNNCTSIATVNIPNPPVLNASISSVNASCSGDSSGSATAHVSGGVGPYTFNWTPYGGIDSTATHLIPGAYSVTVTDVNGCSITLSDSIHQNTTITIVIDSVIPASCNGTNTGSIFITVSGGTGNYTYLWNPGSFHTEDINNVVAGNYIVIVTDQNNCTQSDSASISEPPPVVANAGRDTSICAWGTIQLSANTLAPGSIGVWSSMSVPDTSFSNINDPNATVTNVPPGFNTLTWTVTDASGCSSSDNVTIFNFNLTVNAGNDINLCEIDSLHLLADSVHLNATPIAGYSGVWTVQSNIFINDSTLNNATILLHNFGIDTLTWTIGSNACKGSDTLVVAAYQKPIANAGDSQNVCLPNAKLMAIVTGPGNGYWMQRVQTPAIIADSLNPATDVSNLQPHQTVFVWTMMNGTCGASDTVIIDYDPTCELQLPSGFSPNGDLHDDGYYIKGIEGYPNNTFRVFNRWGNEVYVKQNYQNTDGIGEWIGQNKNGEELPEGTYYVILKINDHDITKNTYVDLRRFTNNK